jgi:hypothetical protein
MRVEGGNALLEAHALDRSKYGVSDGGASAADFATVDEPWMAKALQEQFSRVQS